MQFTTRRNRYRWTFVLVCLTPTLLIACAAAVTHSPIYVAAAKAEFESDLAATLGLGVRVGCIGYASNDRLVVQDGELFDPESLQWLVRFRSAEVVRTDRGLLVQVSQPEVRSRGLERLIPILHEQVLLRHGMGLPSVQLTATSLVVQSAPRGESFESIRCSIRRQTNDTEILFACCRSGEDRDDPIRLRVVRNRQLDPPATGWELHTGPTPLPCSIAQPWLASLSHLGSDCTFQGSIWCEQMVAGWSGELAGEFQHVDLDQLITNQFPHKLSGVATLSIDCGTMDGGYIVEATGDLTSAGGTVGQSLLDAASRSLGLRLHSRADDSPLIRYQKLQFGFSLNASRMSIQGRVDDQGAVMTGAQGSLLSQNGPSDLSPVAVLQLLVPQSEVQVPATRETAGLLHALPLPKIVPPAANAARVDYSPLLLR